MTQGDTLGVIIVYVYVASLILITDRVISKRYPMFGRKFLHIMTGNIAFILPLFNTREIMVFLAAAPFILFTFMISPYSPVKSMQIKASKAGHGLGLVYYSITWTVLGYLFFNHKEIIAVGILAMSYGDGLASVIGVKYGGRTYNVFGDVKSYAGSCVMFLSTFIIMIVALIFYDVSLSHIVLFYLVFIAFITTLVEGLTPKGIDNITVPFITAGLYWLFYNIRWLT
jgi:phytol kinase